MEIGELEPAASQLIDIGSVVKLTHLVVGKMMGRRRRSGIVFMSSLAASTGMPSVAVYAGTKAFLKAFSLSLSQEAKEKVDVMCVEAAVVSTAMTDFAPINAQVSSPSETVSGALADIGQCVLSAGSEKHRRVMRDIYGGKPLTDKEYQQMLIRASSNLGLRSGGSSEPINLP